MSLEAVREIVQAAAARNETVVGVTSCQECGDSHQAVYSHEGRFDEGPVFAVVCPVDNLTDYYTLEVVSVVTA